MIINSSEEMAKYLVSTENIDFSKFSSTIQLVEYTVIIPLIGKPLYDRLQAYANGSSESEVEQLFDFTQRAITFLTFDRLYAILNMKIGDSGVFANVDQENRRSLYQYETIDAQETIRFNAYEALDNILNYCEENIAKFQEFTQSNSYIDKRKYFVFDVKTAIEYYPTLNKRLVFLKLFPAIKTNQKEVIKPLIGAAFMNELLSYLYTNEDSGSGSGNTENENYNLIINAIQCFLVNKSISQELFKLQVEFNDTGLFVNNQLSTGSNYKEKKNIDSSLILKIREECNNKANSKIEWLRKFLNINADSFPTYKNSTSYVEVENTPHTFKTGAINRF